MSVKKRCNIAFIERDDVLGQAVVIRLPYKLAVGLVLAQIVLLHYASVDFFDFIARIVKLVQV